MSKGKKSRSLREQLLDLGKKFDKKIARIKKKAKEEVQQFNDMGGISHVGEYIAQNATSALSQGASALGDNGLVQRIEGRRSQIVSQGKKFDKKVQEEVQQFNDMGGISHVGEYIAQNATSALSQGASALGDDNLAQRIEGRRSQIVAQGKKFDKKVQEEITQFGQAGGVGEYLAQNISEGYDDFKSARVNINIPKVGELEFNVSDSKSPIVSLKDDTPKVLLVQGCPVQSNKPSATDKSKSGGVPTSFAYKKAELLVQNLSDNFTRESTIIDGKKHGAEVIRNSQNQILDVKLYNHGNPVDLTSNTLAVRQEVGENGVVHSYCLLNSQKFGTETLTDSDGKMITTFYEEGGFVMDRNEHSQIIVTTKDGDNKANKALLASLTEQKLSAR